MLLPVLLRSGETLFVAGLDTSRTNDSSSAGHLFEAVQGANAPIKPGAADHTAHRTPAAGNCALQPPQPPAMTVYGLAPTESWRWG